MNKNTKTIFSTLVFFGIAVVLLYFSFHNQDIDGIFDAIKKADYFFIAIALLAGVASHLFRALRWNLLLKPMGYKATKSGAFHSVIIGYLVNMVIPRGGELARPTILSKTEGIPMNKLLGTIVTERIVDMLITMLIGITIVFIQFEKIKDLLSQLTSGAADNLPMYLTIGLIGILGVILVYKLRFKIYQLPIVGRFKNFIEGMLEGVRSILALEKRILFIAYSLLIWLMYFLMPYFILYALPGTSHLGVSAALTILLFGTAAMIIPSPGGFGTFHKIVPAALLLYGIDDSLGLTYATLTHSIQTIVILSVGIVSVIYFALKMKSINHELEGNN